MLNFDKNKVLSAIKKSNGIISVVAKVLGCEWHTAQKYINKWESTKQALANEGEKILDLAENVIITALNENDQQTAKWLLATKGKNRGYTERQEITGKDGDEIIVKLVDDEANTVENL